MKLSARTEILEVVMLGSTGSVSTIHPVLVHGEDGATLIDTGMAGQLDRLAAAVEAAGTSLSQIKHIVLTHQDVDHIGNLPQLLNLLGDAVEVYCHEADKPYIEGELPLIKFNRERFAPMLESMPPEARAALEEMLAHPPAGKVDHLLADGEHLPWLEDVKVIYTPGHTPGHLCLFLEEEGLLLAADAMRVVGGKLVGPAEAVTPDMPQALRSLQRLLEYPIRKVLCYHGGLFDDHPLERIAELAEGSRA